MKDVGGGRKGERGERWGKVGAHPRAPLLFFSLRELDFTKQRVWDLVDQSSERRRKKSEVEGVKHSKVALSILMPLK